MKEYVLGNRTIVATEKAYNVLYKEQGFKVKGKEANKNKESVKGKEASKKPKETEK